VDRKKPLTAAIGIVTIVSLLLLAALWAPAAQAFSGRVLRDRQLRICLQGHLCFRGLGYLLDVGVADDGLP
jgi:hypothetical protein